MKKTIVKNFLKKKYPISREYIIFASLTTLLISITCGIFYLILYKNFQENYKQKYLSINFSVANNYEIFLDNILRQSESIAHKIIIYPDNKDLLKHRFSLGVDLDTSLISNWITFKFVDNKSNKRDNYLEIQKPWKINFGESYSNTSSVINSYIPISFGITNEKDTYVGKLVGNINISNLLQYLQYSLKDKSTSILILDKDNYIIGQSPKNLKLLPRDFFKSSKFDSNFNNIAQYDSRSNNLYLSYKKLNSYPFTIVIGENQDKLLTPFKSILIKYLYVFLVILVSFLIILLLFYRKIITPIIKLSGYAQQIIQSKNKIDYSNQKYSFDEVKNLEKALIKIESYKKRISDSNQELNKKTKELIKIKSDLEIELAKLFESYKLRDEMNTIKYSSLESINTSKSIKDSLKILYPEIYSRRLKIKESIDTAIILNIKYHDFINIVLTLLSKSFTFSKKGGTIIISTKETKINNTEYFSLTVSDHGLGNEEWRENSIKINSIRELVAKHNGLLHHINENNGVKYCLLLPINRVINKEEESNKIILFPKKPS